MDDKKVSIISLIFSLLGVLIILYLSENTLPPFYQISEIDESLLDQTIFTTGEISLIKETNGLFIFILKGNNSKILVIATKEQELQLDKNKKVNLIGKVLKYRGELEIKAEEIIII
tara:strand:+ start:469 stop:816 length:348 start_codon:yes stop_codon:yes gene_type:complete